MEKPNAFIEQLVVTKILPGDSGFYAYNRLLKKEYAFDWPKYMNRETRKNLKPGDRVDRIHTRMGEWRLSFPTKNVT